VVTLSHADSAGIDREAVAAAGSAPRAAKGVGSVGLVASECFKAASCGEEVAVRDGYRSVA